VGVVKAPLNVMFAASVVSVRTTDVPVATLPLNVAPLLLVMVSVANVVVAPMLPVAEIAPPVPALSVRLCVFAAVPLMVPVIEMLPSAVDESVLIVTEVVAIVTRRLSETLPAVVPPSVLMLLFKVIASAVTDRLPVVVPS
jgi:hypothetical protein